jgi:hypothetical protein
MNTTQKPLSPVTSSNSCVFMELMKGLMKSYEIYEYLNQEYLTQSNIY